MKFAIRSLLAAASLLAVVVRAGPNNPVIDCNLLTLGVPNDILVRKLDPEPTLIASATFSQELEEGCDGWLRLYDSQKVNILDEKPLGTGPVTVSYSHRVKTDDVGLFPQSVIAHVTLRGTDKSKPLTCERSIEWKEGVVDADLAVDSNNDGEYTDADVAVEDVPPGEGSIEKMGHHVQINSFDYDADQVPDLVDGFSVSGSAPVAEAGETIGGNPPRRFTQLICNLSEMDPSDWEFMLSYSASDPARVKVATGPTFGNKKLVGGEIEDYVLDVPSGRLRLWRRDASASRKAEGQNVSSGAGDYVPTGEWIPGSKLFTAGGVNTLYIEGINPSKKWAEDSIDLTIRIPGSATAVLSADSVSITVAKCVLHAWAYRPYTFEPRGNPPRPQLKIDWTSPATAISTLVNLASNKDPSPDSRQGLCWYGHGFWHLEYLGPATTDLADKWSGKSGNGLDGSLPPGVPDNEKDNELAIAYYKMMRQGDMLWRDFGGGRDHGILDKSIIKYTDRGPLIQTANQESMKIPLKHAFVIPPAMGAKAIRYSEQHFSGNNKYGFDISATTGGCASYLGLTCKVVGIVEHSDWELSNKINGVGDDYFPENGLPLLPPLPELSSYPSEIDYMKARREFIEDIPGFIGTSVFTVLANPFGSLSNWHSWDQALGKRVFNYYDPGYVCEWMDNLRINQSRSATIYLTEPENED